MISITFLVGTSNFGRMKILKQKRKSINKQTERLESLFIRSTGQILIKGNRLTDVGQRETGIEPSRLESEKVIATEAEADMLTDLTK